MTTPIPKNPLAHPGDGEEHHKTHIRQITGRWAPANQTDAQRVAEESIGRAQSLTSIFAQYCWGDQVSVEDLKFGLEAIDDLLCLAYAMMEWWQDDAKLIEHGWTPPKANEVQP
jgi:hypothetical protein